MKLVNTFDNDDYERDSWAIVDGDGDILEDWVNQPTLETIREVSRRQGGPLERVDLWENDLHCFGHGGCGEPISGRFGAGPEGQPLCWDCVEDLAEDGLTLTDPTKTIVSDSALHEKSLCDYVLNVATGCSYGCRFCYVPSTLNIWARSGMLEERAGVEEPQAEWRSYLLYRYYAPERLQHVASARSPSGWDDWEQTRAGRGIVGISFHTDCY